ncbi:MAG: hypothetical protein ACRDOL_06085, partial [Streptosporangiaceae bacterium]
MYDEDDNDGKFPDESPVEVRYPRSKQEEMVFPQLAKRAVRPVGGSREHIADLDVAVGDDHAV